MKDAPLRKTFEKESERTITVQELAHMLSLPTAFALLIDKHIPFDISTKKGPEPGEQEVLKFVPEKYPPLEDGSALTCKDFWLQVALRTKGTDDMPMMGLKFMDLGNGVYDVSSPYLMQISGDMHFRPTFGHHIITQIETTVHDMMGKQIKADPPDLRHR